MNERGRDESTRSLEHPPEYPPHQRVSNVRTGDAVPTAAQVVVRLADGSVEFDLDENCRIRRYDASDTGLTQ